MLDAVVGMVDQDRILAQRIADEGRACVIALNKWDAIESKNDESFNKGVDLCISLFVQYLRFNVTCYDLSPAAVDHVRYHLSALRWADVSIKTTPLTLFVLT